MEFLTTLVLANALTCQANFGFSKWSAEVDFDSQMMYVIAPNAQAHGMYSTFSKGRETTYFISYEFGQGASLTVGPSQTTLCIDTNTCSVCR